MTFFTRLVRMKFSCARVLSFTLEDAFIPLQPTARRRSYVDSVQRHAGAGFSSMHGIGGIQSSQTGLFEHFEQSLLVTTLEFCDKSICSRISVKN